MKYETLNEYMTRRFKTGKNNPVEVFILFSIPIVNIFIWIGLLLAYKDKRKVSR